MKIASLRISVCVIVVCVLVSSVSADTFGNGANQFTIEFVDISGDSGDLGSWSAGTDYTFSGVNHGDYRMGKFEITNDQWDKFRASVGGKVTGSPSNAYDESAYYTGTNVPTNMLSWYEAAQFVNWLNTSTGHQAAYKFTGTQGTSNYTFCVWNAGDTGYDSTNPYRNSNAHYFIPTEDEWVKAAYWNGTSLQTYATVDDSVPVAGVDTMYAQPYPYAGPWDVGSGSEELNGTFDMMGNLMEWMESPRFYGEYTPIRDRVVRGGRYFHLSHELVSSSRSSLLPYDEFDGGFDVGFRVASVPEPTIIQVAVDIKPGSCPNPLVVNFKGNGVIPVAILGTEDFYVEDIDVATITLEGISPIRSNFEDVSTSFDVEECECSTEGPDGFLDLTLEFKTRDILDALKERLGDLGEIEHRTDIQLILTGMLIDEEEELEGRDCVRLLTRSKIQ